MYCDSCNCEECSEERETRTLREKYKERCKHWNWNYHPIEIAQELKEDGIDAHSEEFEICLEEIESFFGKSLMETVEETCAYLL